MLIEAKAPGKDAGPVLGRDIQHVQVGVALPCQRTRERGAVRPDIADDSDASSDGDPGDQWGELHFRKAKPDAGKQWTDDGFGRDDRRPVVPGDAWRPLASNTYRRAWDRARIAALSDEEYRSPLARRPYDLRHACLNPCNR